MKDNQKLIYIILLAYTQHTFYFNCFRAENSGSDGRNGIMQEWKSLSRPSSSSSLPSSTSSPYSSSLNERQSIHETHTVNETKRKNAFHVIPDIHYKSSLFPPRDSRVVVPMPQTSKRITEIPISFRRTNRKLCHW